jgi:CRP/FNR family cyclic AMP-dependent transcriptional regulator
MLDNPVLAEAENSLAQLLREPSLGVRRRTAPADTVLHEAGAPADNLFFIQSGQVRQDRLTADGSCLLLDIAGPGCWLGVESIGGPVYTCQAMATSETSVLVVSAQRLLALLPQYPKVSLEIIRCLVARLNTATEEAGGMAFDDCRRRLLRALLRFSRSAAATATRDGVMLRMTHEQLAQAVGSARETVTLALTELRNANMLSTGRNKLTFNPQTLTAALNENYELGKRVIVD